MSNTPLAEFVFDGRRLVVPSFMGSPKQGQLVGTLYERFSEVCGRICYDSLGKGRGSKEFHENIIESKHFNIYEGCVKTWVIECDDFFDTAHCVIALANRPGVFVQVEQLNVRVTLNARAAIEWARHTTHKTRYSDQLGFFFNHLWSKEMPMVFGDTPLLVMEKCPFKISESKPKYEHEKWTSLWLYSSRGLSHEQIRHRFKCHVSQRSTRYCDENESPRVCHPLIRAYNAEHEDKIGFVNGEPVENYTNKAYIDAVEKLETWLKDQGIESPRKMARGAARQYLEHALSTQMIFGGSVSAWKWMLDQRGAKWAEGEIQELYNCEVAEALKDSQYAEDILGKN